MQHFTPLVFLIPKSKHISTGDSPIDDSPLIVSLPLSLFTSSAVSSLFQLARRCGNQLKEWRLSSWQTENDLHAISLSKICRGNPFTVIISADFNWSFFIGSTSICLQQCTCLASLISTHLNSVDLVGQLVTYIEKKSVCLGNPDDKFIEIRKLHDGIFKSRSGN